MTGPWRKPSRSGGASANCVETRMNGSRAQVRDSKLGEASPIISLPHTDYAALLDTVVKS